jgi:hypothetical protein
MGAGPNLLVDMDRQSESTGVQINWDTGGFKLPDV